MSALTIRGLSHHDQTKIQTAFDREREKRLSLIESGKKSGRALIGTGAAAGMAATLGALSGYKDTTEVMGMPLDGALGAACHVAAFFVDGKSESDELIRESLFSAGNAALALFVFREVEKVARDKKNET